MSKVDTFELKKLLGERARDIIADGLSFPKNRTGKVLCPLHSDTNPSMSWFSEGLNWRCHACEGNIDILSYYTDFENMSFPEALDKVKELVNYSEPLIVATSNKYVLPDILHSLRDISPTGRQYMAQRGISEETLNHFDVKMREWNNNEVYVYQYFNEKNILEYVSYRGVGKKGLKGGCEKNTKSILWNMNRVDVDKPVVITEGQPDCMAVYEAGYTNVVSVPNGAKNFKWIDNNWDWLQTTSELIVFGDNDVPGLEMAKEIKRRLNNVKIMHSEKYKDANEVLYFEGKEALLKMIMDVIESTPAGITDVAHLKYESAMDKKENGIETGFWELDSHLEDLKLGEISVIFGRNGEGKTTFISQMIAHALEKETKTFLYSGEMSDNKIQDWLYRQLIGDKKQYLRKIKTKYKDKTEPLPEVVKAIKEWHKGNLFLYDKLATEVVNHLDVFFHTMEVARKRYGVKLFIIDNLMTILEENADSLNSDQANLTQRCKEFAKRNMAHVILLAHPNKIKGELLNGTQGNLDKGDISGSGNIGNKADNIISIERLWGEDRDVDAIISGLKDRETGQRIVLNYFFSKTTLRFFNDVTKETEDYGWEKLVNVKDFNDDGFMDVDDAPPWA